MNEKYFFIASLANITSSIEVASYAAHSQIRLDRIYKCLPFHTCLINAWLTISLMFKITKFAVILLKSVQCFICSLVGPRTAVMSYSGSKAAYRAISVCPVVNMEKSIVNNASNSFSGLKNKIQLAYQKGTLLTYYH